MARDWAVSERSGERGVTGSTSKWPNGGDSECLGDVFGERKDIVIRDRCEGATDVHNGTKCIASLVQARHPSSTGSRP